MFKNELLLFTFYRSENLFKPLNCFKSLCRKTILMITIILTPKKNHLSVLRNFWIKKTVTASFEPGLISFQLISRLLL